jgi:dihydrolipoamide dehydrogenase
VSRSFDLVVIGAGPGGYPAAIRGAQLGLSTACVERELLGGVCLNWGCIPSKALLKTAELANKVRHASDYGISVGELSIDYPKVVERSRGVAKRFNRGVASLFKKYGVTEVKGTARLVAPGRVEVTSSAGTEVLEARHVVVATGARAKVFPGIEPDGERIVTYREAIVSDRRPVSATVLGAGAIGIEFAYFWRAMGAEVTVVEAMDEILPVEDREVAAALRKILEKQGIRFVLGTFVDRVDRDGDATLVHLKGHDAPLRADTTLVALGITPNSAGLGLEDLGVRLDKRGFVEVDASYRTNVPGVYAIGDVNALGPALAHTATRQAHVCVERIAGHHVPDVDYDGMPSCTYCQPQVASVGWTEERCKREGVKYRVGKFPFLANGKAQGAGSPEGFVKVLVGERYGEILGAHILGADATELIAEIVLARSSEATAELLATTVHAHPTTSEAVLEAVADALGVSVHI